MITLFKDDSTELVRDDLGEHFLIVHCGGIATFDYRVRLTEEDLALVHDFGDYYIQKLAAEILHEPTRFRDRFVGGSIRLDD
jgi:hypothetical protein